PPPSSLAPRPVRANDPGGGLPGKPGGGLPGEPRGGFPDDPGGGLPPSATGGQGWVGGDVRWTRRDFCCNRCSVPFAFSLAIALLTQFTSGLSRWNSSP